MHEQIKEAMRHVHTGLVWTTAKVSGESMTSLQTHTQVRHSTSAGHRMVTKRIKSSIVAEWEHGSTGSIQPQPPPNRHLDLI